MLFNSAEFILLFLPVSLLLFFYLAKHKGNEVAIAALVICSLFFYGWWNPNYLGLILFSMLFNYGVGVSLGSVSSNPNKKILLIF